MVDEDGYISEGVELIETTADMGMSVKAPTLDMLFERAARGLFSVITDLSSIQHEYRIEILLTADETETLFVRWLNRLLFLFDSERMLFSSFQCTGTPNKMIAICFGEYYNNKKHSLYEDIKAVTYHKLRVEQKTDYWEAEVIFDL